MREEKGSKGCCKQDHVGIGRVAARAPFDTFRSLPHGRGQCSDRKESPSMLTVLITKGGHRMFII